MHQLKDMSGPARRMAVFVLLAAALLPAVVPAAAQVTSPDSVLTRNPYGTGAGLAIALTNSGFGLGGYYVHSVGRNTSLIAELQIGPGKDEREVKFFGYFGNSYIPDKANYFLMVPVQIGLQHRLFADVIEENFRPFVQVMAGPTFGWQYPYFRDCDGDGSYDPSVTCSDGRAERTYDAFGAFFRGKPAFGAGGMIAAGAHFGQNRRSTQGIRIGYSFNYFFREIALLEADVEGGQQRFFGSPTITLTFGRLF